jgi:hypothetical protein
LEGEIHQFVASWNPRMASVNPRTASICQHCHERTSREPKRTFLGFQKISCGQCGRESFYPLTQGYYFSYWAAIILICVLSAVELLNGALPIPGVFFFAVVYGLYQDRKLFRQILAKPPSEQLPNSLGDWLESGDVK